jgi:hypothetical protein
MAGYTRQAAANITTGSVIDADDFNDEYNQVQSAFNASTGHTHDGTAAEGAPIEKIGPSQDLVVTASQVRPKTTNALDLGTSALQFKDGHFDGTVKTDGLTVDENATVAGNLTVTGQINGQIQAGAVSNISTTNITEGNNQYFTQARARQSLSAGSGISYNNSTGAISTSGASAGNGTITISPGTGLTGGGSFTVNQSGNATITLNNSVTSTGFGSVGSLAVGHVITGSAASGTYTHSAGSNYAGSSILFGSSAGSGTWKCLSPAATSQTYVYNDNAYTTINYRTGGLYQRIS